MQRSATFSACGYHRIVLTRTWDDAKGLIGWCMLNPSVADHTREDPTMRRVIDFSIRWGYGGLVVTNLFTAICTNSKALWSRAEMNAPDADRLLVEALRPCQQVVCGWGEKGVRNDRDRQVLGLLQAARIRTVSLGLNDLGTPKHPLYVPKLVQLQPYAVRSELARAA